MPCLQRFPPMAHRCAIAILLLGILAVPAQALTIRSFTPLGAASQVQQVTVRFNEDAVRFGDPKAQAPVTLQCDDAAAAGGEGRWTSSREWVYDFPARLPPGVRCEADLVSGFTSPSGSKLQDSSGYTFHTGGPYIESTQPSRWEPIEEEQVFVLQLNGAATPQSIQDHVWCAIEGVGERVPVRRLDDAQRHATLQSLELQKIDSARPGQLHVLECARRFTPDAKIQIVYGPGVATPSGIAYKEEQRLTFTVRKPFVASISCERENAQAACTPIRPIELSFSAPVPRSQLEDVRLLAGGTEHAPRFNGDDAGDTLLERVLFDAPLPERATLTLKLPANLQDASGRPLANADSFPLAIDTGPMPPLVKFAAAPFGIVERFAEGPAGPALLPLNLRRVEPALQAASLQINNLQPQSDAHIIRWFTRVQRYNQWLVERDQARRDLRQQLPPPVNDLTREYVESRTLSLLAGEAGVQTIDLPPPPTQGERPFEVIGVPLPPGFHVLEVSSSLLGQALLDAGYGLQRPMMVRSSVLVTNLGVHFKQGREGSLAWITSLDQGQPVAGARVQVSDCHGKPVASATTDGDGLARFNDLPAEAPRCQEDDGYIGDFQSAWFVSARSKNHGVDDMAFTWSSWQRGIEGWRFNVPTSDDASADVQAHTLFDRTLLRAGETVSMKHVLRSQTGTGFGLPASSPDELIITHVGSGQEYRQALAWRQTATGGRSAESQFDIPRAARLGVYEVSLNKRGSDSDRYGDRLDSGSFRVEEFRLPLLQGRVGPVGGQPLVAATHVPVQVQLNYVGGGPAKGLPVQVSALARDRTPSFPDYKEFSFDPAESDRQDPDRAVTSVVADKLATTLDAEGLGGITIDSIRPAATPRQLVIEATYADPSGELQTLHSNQTLWPAGVVVGIQAENWLAVGRTAQVQVLALDLQGQPRAGVPLEVRTIARRTISSRKRMVGGFYTYDSQTETEDLGTVCTGTSDERGRLLCKVDLTQPGNIELVARASDDAGRRAQAATSVWVTRYGELWFGGRDDDRMDVLPEQKRYAPGETARLQVRMPFRRARALVSVERESILHTEVVELSGDDPTIALKIDGSWGPNVYVSVLALRGRIHDAPWYSFFSWGYKTPRQWWHSYRQGSGSYTPPTGLVDLSKPAFRLGMAELQVSTGAHELAVEVKTDQASYAVRDMAQARITVRMPDGQPAAHAEVALAAVDQALLELMPNRSWDLLDAMLVRRAWGVETATAQTEIVGRRHYGRKAVPAGGDGGAGSPTRELLDTLLLWQPRIQLDGQGQAQVEVPINDALTGFRIVAIADMGTGLFGTGEASIRTTQDLQIISGLPPLVRAGDEFSAMLTLRNTTAKAMNVEVRPRATALELPAQTVAIAAGDAHELHWDVTAPPELVNLRSGTLLWEIEARDLDSDARDALKASQRIVPAVPLTVQQATLVQLDDTYMVEVAAPARALPATGSKRGGLNLSLQPSLAEGLPAIRDWFARYPYTCLEQLSSKAIGMDDEPAWHKLMVQLPAYLDDNGLAYYFPPAAGNIRGGSDTLTAWLLAASDEAARLNPAWRLPEESRRRMVEGLTDFVSGRIERNFWSPRKDLDVRKLAAIEALSRHGAARADMLGSISIAPQQWPTSAVIDWVGVLQRVKGIPEQPRHLRQAMKELRSRLSVQGTRLVFSTERQDGWWWLMAGGDVNAARLLLTVMDDTGWADDIGRLVSGFIGRQQRGVWNTTTANLWGSLALRQFSLHFESAPVAGVTQAVLGHTSEQVDWQQVSRLQAGESIPAGPLFGTPAEADQLSGNTMALSWPEAANAGSLIVRHDGSGRPWLTLQSLAAVQLEAPFAAGYRIRKTITPIEQADSSLPAGHYSRGDILRVALEVTASTPMIWVVITDPIPGGAIILGSGLGRDSSLATQGEQRDDGRAWLAYEERSFESFRSYYRYLPQGQVSLEYTLRLNNAGRFQLPPSRIEAIYAPEMFGETPNAVVHVGMP